MKPIELEIAFMRASSTASSGVSIGMKSAKDLSNEDISNIMPLVGTIGKMIYIPNVAEDVPTYKIDKTVNEKSPSQVQRAILYRIWEQKAIKDDFNVWYRGQMDRINDKLKEQLE